MKQEILKIEGMNCEHCVMAVKKELSKLQNVKVKDVQIGTADIEFDESKVDKKALADAIEEAGYTLALEN
jgi:copper chaperone